MYLLVWLSDEFKLGVELEFDSASLSNVGQCLDDLSGPQLVARWRHLGILLDLLQLERKFTTSVYEIYQLQIRLLYFRYSRSLSMTQQTARKTEN